MAGDGQRLARLAIRSAIDIHGFGSVQDHARISSTVMACDDKRDGVSSSAEHRQPACHDAMSILTANQYPSPAVDVEG